MRTVKVVCGCGRQLRIYEGLPNQIGMPEYVEYLGLCRECEKRGHYGLAVVKGKRLEKKQAANRRRLAGCISRLGFRGRRLRMVA